jgi:hypothetical protein
MSFGFNPPVGSFYLIVLLDANILQICFISYLAEGCSMKKISRNFLIGKSITHYIIKETCTVLWEVLVPLYLRPPKLDDFVQMAREFERRWNFPHCLGALDGKHVIIQCPYKTGSEYFDYKKSFR